MKQLSRKARAFTLVEIMIVVAIIALLAAVALPGLLRARKRQQATHILNDLRMIDAAIEQFAAENNKGEGAPVGVSEWKKYVKEGTHLYATGSDVFDQAYGPQLVGRLPQVSKRARSALADVADDAFWFPYNRNPTAPATPAETVARPEMPSQ
jgi:prepilin-type N-terminal cleavage/methylation domain-containing protein